MPIRFRCPSGHKLAAPEDRAGRKARCPECKQIVTIPGVLIVANEPAEEAKSSVRPPPLKPRAKPRENPPAIPRVAEGEEKSVESANPQAVATAATTTPAPNLTETLGESGENAPIWARWISTEPGYRPDRSRVQTVRLLAAALALLTGICLWPALANLGSFGDRLWVSAVIFLSALQLAYIIWMVSVPDWSTLRVMMGVFTCVAAMYGMGMAVAFFSEPGDATVLHFSGPHARVTLWCGLIVILSGLIVYLLGRCDTSWRRAYWLSRRQPN